MVNGRVRLRFCSGIPLTVKAEQFPPGSVLAWPAWFSFAEGARRLDHRCRHTAKVAAELDTTASQLVRVELKSASMS
jgi:hypothetical protein